MEEQVCAECGKPLPDPPYEYKYCPVCRTLYGIAKRTDPAEDHPFPPKGRDRISERLREGFEIMDDEDQ